MSDDIDRAQNEEERSLAEALRARRPAGPEATGRCLFCDEVVGDAQRWCDAECRDRWDVLRARTR